MTKTTKPAANPSADQAVTTALKAKPEVTAAEVASAAGIGRSTASKVLARLASSGQVRRTEGGRDGARRLPDRFALASAEPTATKDSTPKASESAKPKAPDDRLVVRSPLSGVKADPQRWLRGPARALTPRRRSLYPAHHGLRGQVPAHLSDIRLRPRRDVGSILPDAES
jgi:hypothetical protein